MNIIQIQKPIIGKETGLTKTIVKTFATALDKPESYVRKHILKIKR